MNIAAYIRVSSQSQVTSGDSLDGQRLSIESWANDNGHTVVDWYIDEGVSAYNGATRKEFNRLLSNIKNDQLIIDAVVVYALSRFSRTLLGQQQGIKQLRDKNISLLSTSEPLPEDPDSNALMLAFVGLIDEQNSRQTARTVCHRLADTARKGFFTGGPIPFGYKSVEVQGGTAGKRKKLEVEGEEAEIVKTIFKLSLNGTNGKPFGIKKIASHLNDSGLTIRGRRWTTQTISKLLNNTAYYGDYIFNSKSGSLGKTEKIIVKIPRVIDKKLFNSVQSGLASRVLSNRSSKSYQSKSLLTGILSCGECKSRLVLVSGKSGKYKYYACHNKINKSAKSCNSRYIAKDELEKKIIDIFMAKVLTKESIVDCKDKLRKIANDRSKDNGHSMSSLKAKKSKLELGVRRFLDEISNGNVFNSSVLNEYINERQTEIDNINAKIGNLKKHQEIPALKFSDNAIDVFIASSKQLIDNGDREAIKQLLLATIDKVVIYGTKKKLQLMVPTLALIQLVSKTKGGTDFSVPPFVSRWWRDRDLNPRTAINGCR
ncbi:recombinase family protein, partial [Vibrio sp. 10N.247.311.12]|uniref:recombinase family protein n=1 Tax=Vibrio sp. 10N.247.311.12 TaxID=3229991 RepID=UPI00354C21BC